MVQILIVCEGQTEREFVKNLLVEYLALKEIYVRPTIGLAAGGHGGGGLRQDRIRRVLRNALKEYTLRYVTTFFDLYGLPDPFYKPPGIEKLRDPIDRAKAIEKTFHEDIVQFSGCRSDRFIPHIQPFEFESLLFTDIRKLGDIETNWSDFLTVLQAIKRKFEGAEYINDGPNTHPSKLLSHLQPTYKKVFHGPEACKIIGLERIRDECQHFSDWISRLEALQPLS